jgi:glycosyltransferase involved in cell wall biosynthesis
MARTNISKVDLIITTNKNNPLISVLVVSYNSAKYITETLESVKSQTYNNIELIVTDDCSIDNTVSICRTWIHKNKERFVRTKLITIDKNSGISANCNRAIKEARGEWLRFVAGDDALFREAVKDALEYINLNKDANIVTSSKAIYKDTFIEENLIEISDETKVKNEKGLSFYDLSSHQQYLSLLYSNKVNPIGILIKKKLMIEVGGFDERIKFLEDYPLFLKITKHGEKIFCMNKLTVKYRVHDSSVQIIKTNKNTIFNNKYLTLRKFRKLYIYPNVNLLNRFIFEFEYYRHYYMDLAKLNRNNFLCRGIYRITELISPWKIRRFYYRKRY